MADWIYKLQLKDLHDGYKGGSITIDKLGIEVSKRLRKMSLPEPYDFEAEDIASDFEDVQDVEDYDAALERLYDLADSKITTPDDQMQRKLMWVNTF